jgi:hypothetical protein
MWREKRKALTMSGGMRRKGSAFIIMIRHPDFNLTSTFTETWRKKEEENEEEREVERKVERR